MFEFMEWKPKGDFGPPEELPADASPEAATIAAQMRAQLTPEIRQALASILLDEFQAVNTDPSRRERAENVVIESRELKGLP
jgi:hypothetical protein